MPAPTPDLSSTPVATIGASPGTGSAAARAVLDAGPAHVVDFRRVAASSVVEVG